MKLWGTGSKNVISERFAKGYEAQTNSFINNAVHYLYICSLVQVILLGLVAYCDGLFFPSSTVSVYNRI